MFPWQQLARTMAQTVTKLDAWSSVDRSRPGTKGCVGRSPRATCSTAVSAHVDEIIVTNGAMEALNLALAAVSQPGDAVVVEAPCFYACLQAIERLGLRAIEVATDPRTGIDLAALERAIVEHKPAALWLMTNFQNPLTASMDADKKRALVEILHKHRLPMVEDDAYMELYAGDERPASTKAFDREGWVLHCSSFSKTLAPGFRVGWVSAGRLRAQRRAAEARRLACDLRSRTGSARALPRTRPLRAAPARPARPHAQPARRIRRVDRRSLSPPARASAVRMAAISCGLSSPKAPMPCASHATRWPPASASHRARCSRPHEIL